MYLSKFYGLHEVADYWHQVVKINEYQMNRFFITILNNLFQTVYKKNLSIFGWAFKKNTNDSRESASIYVSTNLLIEGAILNIYDPKVESSKIINDLEFALKNHGKSKIEISTIINSQIKIHNDLYESVIDSHAIAILTEWDIFKELNWKRIYKFMVKPAFVFDGRRIVDEFKLKKIGLNVFKIGS